jgi:hypothetical protein
MAQTMGQHYDLAAHAERIERRRIERAKADDSPGGKHVTEDELLEIQDVRMLRLEAESVAECMQFVQKVGKNGLRAPSVIRAVRDLYPNFDDAA